MISSIHFKNFKSWKALDLPMASVTALFGTNSSGKTSILQFLLMLKQTKDATDRKTSFELNGEYTSVGSARDVIYKHDEQQKLDFTLSFFLENEIELATPTQNRKEIVSRADNITIEGQAEIVRKAFRSTLLRYRVGDAEFSLSRKSNDSTEFRLSSTGTEFNFTRTQGRSWQLPGPSRSYAFPDQARTYFQNAAFLSDLELAYESQLDNVYYLGPLRTPPERDYLWARSRPSDVGQLGEKTIDAILAATDANEKRNLGYKKHLKPFQEIVAHWLRQMGLIDTFKVEEIAEGSNRWQVKVKTRKNPTEVLLTEVGFGVSQILPVITLLYYVPEGSTVIFEQPEIHLHPLAQAHLADLILNVSKTRKIQVIVESHSEHFLLRLQRRVAENVTAPEDVKLYFCNTNLAGSNLIPLDLDLFGTIRNWPKDFMGDAFGETLAAEEARLKRMIID